MRIPDYLQPRLRIVENVNLPERSPVAVTRLNWAQRWKDQGGRTRWTIHPWRPMVRTFISGGEPHVLVAGGVVYCHPNVAALVRAMLEQRG